MLTRRTVLAAAPFALPALLPARAHIKVGVCDWNLRKAADITAIAMASEIGFEGLEVSLGRKVTDGALPMDSAVMQSRFVTDARERRITLTSTCLDVLHVHYMKLDPLGAKFTSDAIRITRAMGAPLILLPYFGKGALDNRDDMARVADILKEIIGEAERSKVVLALENTISAEDNAFMMDRVGSDYLKVYYDVANSHYNGFDVPKEIRWLGKQRIGQVHFKERGYLGSGAVPLAESAAALHEIGYEGFINLELPSPSGDIPADMRRNLEYTRKLMAA
ncbi:MAG: sugar phosphate isomerase/epimerase [Bryobacterales bacterium]|nr:sugar phosphate isomerase/epimerase [Bryobacterales bacterium]